MSVRLSVYSGSSDDASGYLLFRVDGDDVESVGPRFVAVHRLAALAWGDIDSLSDALEIHHRDGCPVHNSEQNVEALEPREHGRVTRQQVERRTQA